MGKMTNFGFAPPQDPMFGIQRKNIVPRLTRNNWRTKAACRTIDGQCLYVMIQLGKVSEDGQTERRYVVTVHHGGSISQDFRADFQKLKDATAYANGQDGSGFAEATQLATSEEYPIDRGADTYITGFTGRGIDRRSNFTIRLPGEVCDDE